MIYAAALVPLVIAVVNVGVAVLVWRWLVAESKTRRRVAFMLAALSISTLLLLGGLWPNLFTLLAFGVLPAAVGDLVGVFFPQVAALRGLRLYSVTSVLLAAASYTVLFVFWFFGGVAWSAA